VGAAAATAAAMGAWGSPDVEPDHRCMGILEQRDLDSGLTSSTGGEQGRQAGMGGVPSRQARLAHAAKHAEWWNAGKKDEWVASWRTICPGEVRMFDPVRTEEKHGFDTATSEAFDLFQSILKIKMVTVQVNGNEMAWVCENHFGAEPNIQMAYSIETFAWDVDGSLLIKTYYPMPGSVGPDSDPYEHLLEGQP
jgi:hypothetical protein